MQKTDSVFLKHFAQLIAVLFVIMVLLIIGANTVYDRLGLHGENTHRKEETLARLAPVADSFAGEAGRAAMAAAQQAAQVALAAQVAFDGALDAELIYNNVCSACHTTGAGGAPAPNATAWAPRLAKGAETLLKHAIEGYTGEAGVMPAKGGRPDLSDEQVKVTVEYMIKKYQ